MRCLWAVALLTVAGCSSPKPVERELRSPTYREDPTFQGPGRWTPAPFAPSPDDEQLSGRACVVGVVNPLMHIWVARIGNPPNQIDVLENAYTHARFAYNFSGGFLKSITPLSPGQAELVAAADALQHAADAVKALAAKK